MTASYAGRPSFDNALVVFARYPTPGTVKRRLAAALGDEAATEIYRAFLEDWSRGAGSDSRWVTSWAYTPADSPFERDFARGRRAFPQGEGDLGERMRHALAETLARGHRAAALVGVDVPHLPVETIASAFDAIAGGAELALVPAADGGYALIAARTVPDVFSGIAWGTSEVLAATLERARAARLTVDLLPGTFDVDRLEDAERLAEELAAGRLGPLPATERALRATLSKPSSRV